MCDFFFLSYVPVQSNDHVVREPRKLFLLFFPPFILGLFSNIRLPRKRVDFRTVYPQQQQQLSVRCICLYPPLIITCAIAAALSPRPRAAHRYYFGLCPVRYFSFTGVGRRAYTHIPYNIRTRIYWRIYIRIKYKRQQRTTNSRLLSHTPPPVILRATSSRD